jgi:hypothetical protein
MPSKRKKITIAGITYVLLFAGAGAGVIDRDKDDKCGGVERWEEKVVIDDLASEITSTPRTTTIESLNAISTTVYAITKNSERQDIEKQVYTIKNCFITKAILESDNDIHLVIEDGNKRTMIAEIPDPKCPDAKHSDFISDYRKARTTFLRYQDVYHTRRFDITGVLFIDKKHAKSPTGNASNNIELHPVINIVPKQSF